MSNDKICPNCGELLDEQDICPNCGSTVEGGSDINYLKPGTNLHKGRYLVGGVDHKNGEGALYDGFDYKNRETCWIREYFPTTLAKRDPKTGQISPLEGLEAQYKALTSDFVDVCNEIKRLEVTEKVIPIKDVFVENNTVYAIYQSMNVVSFDEYLAGIGGKLPLQKAVDMFLPLCNMLGTIHDHGHIHRGISPYTVYVDEDDNLYLWHFALGATRTANSELNAELFNGYSAPEQYASNGWQGAWTDIYAIAALFYRTVSGFVPPKSTLVGEDRPLSPLEDLVLDMPKNISEAVEEAMAVNTEDRTQAIYNFTSQLVAGEISNTAVYDTSKTKRLAQEAKSKESNNREISPRKPRTIYQKSKDERDGGFKYAILALVFTVLALLGGVWYVMHTYFPTMLGATPSKPESHSLEDIDSSIDEDSESSSSSGESSESGPVPRFVGQMLSVIKQDESYNSLFVFTVEEAFNDEFPEGVVFRQSPEAGTPTPDDGAVTLYVSKGGSRITMPNIIGNDFSAALKTLGDMGLSCDRVDRTAVGAVANSVVGTTPAPGEEFDPSQQRIVVYVMPASTSSESSEEEQAPQNGDEDSSGDTNESSGSKSESSVSSSSSKSSSTSSSKSSSSSKASSTSSSKSSSTSSTKRTSEDD